MTRLKPHYTWSSNQFQSTSSSEVVPIHQWMWIEIKTRLVGIYTQGELIETRTPGVNGALVYGVPNRTKSHSLNLFSLQHLLFINGTPIYK